MGEISTIIGTLSELDKLDRLEAGLMLREAVLISGLLYSAEAWSGLTEKHLTGAELQKVVNLGTRFQKNLLAIRYNLAGMLDWLGARPKTSY